jgi:transitional endoplasmic reticulum ATPase
LEWASNLTQKLVQKLGVTNLAGNLDPAVLRPGVFIGLPDLEALTELLRVYMKDRPQETIDWLRIAEKAKF